MLVLVLATMQRIQKLVEFTLPEYRERHIFTSKLRIAVFIGFWVLYLYFLRDVLSQTKVITAIICICSFLTGLAYYYVVMRNKLLIASFTVELLADLTIITSVIYLTGGPYSPYYTIYVIYCFAAGIFYNHYLASIVAFFSIIFYGGFLWLCNLGLIPPLILSYGDRLPIPAYTPLAHFFFALVFLGLAIYGVKIASYFSQKKERMLEVRNKELEELHHKLKKINEELQEANHVKSEFLAVMSHELRTPLTAIIGFSELLMENVVGELNQAQRESLQEVLNNGADLLELINSLLDLSKIESGKMKLDINTFDLREMIERVQGMIASLVQRKEHSLLVTLPEKLPAIQADERKLQQVMLNLLSNAIKFTPNGGKIDLQVNYQEPGRFKSGTFEIIVQDTGVGIKPEHLDIIFEVFQQADNSITRSFGGTGLGLALAKQYVEQHKGIVWAESEYGKGAKFHVLLPRVYFN
ncbi:MAG: HAMP domain-containing sensor histidine kinase [Pseudomonadota bacterium]